MIVTTTSTIDGRRIEAYLGVVSAHVVAGTGAFSDIAAGFSDLFGGRSHSYQKQVSSIYDEALNRLKSNAQRARANALVGVSMDVDEISGGGKSMMMITATGTAVRLASISKTGAPSNEDVPGIDYREVTDLERTRRLANGDPSRFMADEDVDFLIERRDTSVWPRLLEFLRESSDRHVHSMYEVFASQPGTVSSARLIDTMPVAEIGPKLREAYRASSSHLATFLYKRIITLRAGDLTEARVWLASDDIDTRRRAIRIALLPLSYSKDDAVRLDKIANEVESAFPDRSSTEQTSGMMRTREITMCGFCDGRIEGDLCFKCKRNTRGLYKNDMTPEDAASHLRALATALNDILTTGSPDQLSN